MTPELEKEIADKMREARELRRGYADFFLWASDRDLEEWGVVHLLNESLSADGRAVFNNLQSRGRKNDPPDCEAINHQGERVAIEVTELVDGIAIHEHKKAESNGLPSDWADWPKEKFITELSRRLTDKDNRFTSLKDTPYPGGYIVVVHTDEPDLTLEAITSYLENHIFTVRNIKQAFLLQSYVPSVGCCPYYELNIHG